MTIGNIPPASPTARRVSETPAPSSPVNDDRPKALSFSGGAGAQRRSSTVPYGVKAESPQIVQVGDGAPRATPAGGAAANENVAPPGGLADVEPTLLPKRKGHSRAHSFFHGVKWPFGGSSKKAERSPSDLKAPIAAGEPATLELLAKAQELEEAPLENRPSRDGEQPTKERKGGRLPRCIKPRTSGE
ncbi:hypothetical protein [Bordetella sp. N]|uniref:hypothetical protein n=1 Tax=Bordetella sp. N TaxID=1746199 RepID=UPI0007099633|nr:hypothetical protein [Bordetella sp. N]ALM83411.1 hypothetical protein ASB57_10940 [Bordetella sp. N]